MGVSEAREAIRQQLARAQSQGAEQRLAAASLAAMFNRYASPEQRLSTVAPTELEITGRLPLTARRQAVIQEKVTRAVTLMGHSIRHPGEEPQHLWDDHYAYTDLLVRHSRSAVVLIPEAEPPALFEGLDHVETLAERAMARLVNVLPMSADDASYETRVIELPPVERKAVLEVTEVAKRLNGIGAHLSGYEPVEATMTLEQAVDLAALLKEVEIGEPEEVHLKGRLDGLRFKRQRFWLEAQGGREYEGAVDASLMPKVRELLDRPVLVVLMASTPRDRAGRAKRTTYLLTDVSPVPDDASGLLD